MTRRILTFLKVFFAVFFFKQFLKKKKNICTSKAIKTENLPKYSVSLLKKL